jgi:predicted acylesterase/phospholipase RssA
MVDRYQIPPRLDPLKPPPRDRFCDLVLKGGVVDGVIYPGVLTELAREYRFQSIAGTSVGAIAASLGAASEYARRFGSDDGFNEVLRKIPDELAKVPEPATGQTKLRTLFQPDAGLERIFNVVVDLLSAPQRSKVINDKPMPNKSGYNFGRAVFKNYTFYVLIGFLLGEAIALILSSKSLLAFGCFFKIVFQSWFFPVTSCEPLSAAASILFVLMIPGLLFGLVGSIVIALMSVWRDIKLLTNTPGFGFCSGLSAKGAKNEGLIEWLHKGIQGAAKLPLSRPLTFQDLWDAPGGPKQGDGEQVPKSIDLRMMTTAVSHGRPYELPIADPSVKLYFKIKEFADYFPEDVINHLCDLSNAPLYTELESYLSVVPGAPNFETSPPTTFLYPDEYVNDLEGFRELPLGKLPVIVAVRMSMNFPVLFKAMPLWAIDSEAKARNPDKGAAYPEFRKVWFSDGGVTSNFPIHIFDSPVPAWPTFGVFITDESRGTFYQRLAKAQGQAITKPKGLKFFPRFRWGEQKVQDKGGGTSVEQPMRTDLTNFHTSGRSEKWQLGADDPDYKNMTRSKGNGFTDFLWNIVDSAKDWADNANMRMPGTRDRVVTIFHNGLTNGGLNLKLEPDSIRELGNVNGVEAGKRLVEKFVESALNTSGKQTELAGSKGWLDHRWVRFNTYVIALKAHITGFQDAINFANEVSPTVDQIEASKKYPPLKFEKYFEATLTQTQADALKKAVDAIAALEVALCNDTVVQPYVPKPQPELKARSRL